MGMLSRRVFYRCVRKWIGFSFALCGAFILLSTVVSTTSRRRVVVSESLTLSTSHEKHYNESYALAVRYAEQLTSGIRNSLQLGHLFGEINAKLVEPFVIKSRLFGISKLCPQEQAVSKSKPLGTILDFLKISRECYDITEPVSFKTFLETSARQLVLLHPVRQMDHTRGGDFGVYITDSHLTELKNCIQTDNHVCECGGILKQFAAAVETSLNSYNVTEPFSIRTVICFNADKPLTLASILQSVPRDSPLSYVFTFWYGTACKKQLVPSSQPNDGIGAMNDDQGDSDRDENANDYYKVCTEAERTHVLPRVSFPVKCTKKGSIGNSFVSVEFISHHLNALASNFIKDHHLVSDEDMISVHFRTEWIYTAIGSQETAVQCCLKEIDQFFSSLSAELNVQENSILITDLGPYGTRGCKKSCSKLAKSMLSSLKKNHRLSPVYFDPVDYGEIEDSLVAALVEHASLARGRYLVLIGGGKFQRSILTSAIHIGNVKRVYSICSQTTQSKEGIPPTVEHHSLNACLKEGNL